MTRIIVRSATQQAIRRFDLDAYDGVLAFGDALAEVYRRWGWGERVHVWHEAADTRLFRPPAIEGKREGLVWIGNWGDDERSAELERFLFRPARRLAFRSTCMACAIPMPHATCWSDFGARYRGWLPNARVPEIFARYLATVHVPRRYLCRHASRHSDHQGVRGARLRNSARLGSLGRLRRLVSRRNRLPGGQGRGEMERHLDALAHDPTCARLLSEMGCRPFTAVIPARTAWTN